ncbi:DNA-processing protein DprA [bacterium]|nr:MAG: DNA-processing protein DprA [bacterium]
MKNEQLTPEDLLGPMNQVERKYAPAELFIAGDADLCRNFAKVAVIGTRQVSTIGIKRTQELVRLLVERGVVIVSGLALGVDACAHEAAIKNGGKTIAVLGTPIDQFYPRENAELQRIIMKDYLALSQFKSGVPVQKKNFPIRNRTMALISHATVIIEAGEGSGTLHQGWEALRLGRPLFLLESITKRNDLKWPAEMIGYGAQVLSRGGLEDLFELLPHGKSGVHAAALSF